MKRFAYCFWSVILGIPFLMSVLAVAFRSLGCGCASILLLFLLVKTVPFCHGHENLWMFILSTFSGIPVNSYLAFLMLDWFCAGSYPLWLDILIFIQFFLTLVSVENVVTGFLTRWLWRRQKKPAFVH